MSDTPISVDPEPPRPTDPNRTVTDVGPVPPVSSSILWGTGVTKTFVFGPGMASADFGNGEPVEGGATFDLRARAEPDTWQHPDKQRASAPTPSGRYIVEGEIGCGGVGVVFQGWDIQLKRAVAIKVLRAEYKVNQQMVRRFLEEARITSRLQHPGIVPVHDLGTSPDNRPFFVMRLVYGQTLERILTRRADASADLPRLLTIFLQVSQAIAYAHGQGVIHRDLKPANIMVGTFGVVKVMDWGLAKVLSEPDLSDLVAAAQVAAELSTHNRPPLPSSVDPDLPGTQVGMVFGTPAYLPPEQARGEIDRVDQRADVFGLGSLLCAILTGLPPYTGVDGRAVYDKAATADLADAFIRLNTCRAPLDLLTLAKWCLSPAPSDRPANAGVVVEVMTYFLQADQRRAEQDLVRFFDLSPDCFCIAGTDGYFQRVNENFPRLLGYTAEELTARPFIEFVHPDDRNITGAVLVRISGGDPCIQFQNRYRHVNGHYVSLEWNAQVVPEERAIYAVARDVTERVSQDEAHRRSEQARLHLAAIVDSADVAIYSTTIDSIVQSWNPAAERLYGYRAEEIVGKSLLAIFLPDDDGEEAEILNRLKHSERIEHYESVRLHKDGTAVSISLTVSSLKDEAGNVVGTSRIALNISDRKKAEAALLESEARLRAVIDYAIEAIIMIDSAGTIEFTNRSTGEMFGYSSAELQGRNVSLLMPSHFRERHSRGLAEYLRTGVRKVIGRTVELVGQRKDDSNFPIELSISEIRVADRQLFTGVVRDISVRKQNESLAAEQLRAAGK